MCDFLSEMSLVFVYSDRLTAAVSGAFSVSVRTDGKNSVGCHYFYLHSGLAFRRFCLRQKDGEQEVPLGTFGGRFVFYDFALRVACDRAGGGGYLG